MGINDKISAAIYIGSYSIQMLIARVFPNEGTFETVNEYTSNSKIADNCPSPETFSEDGMMRSLKALKEMHEIAISQGVTEFRICASSSFRNTVNRSQFLLGCHKEFGVFPQLLCGRDEARLNFIGAMTDAFVNLPLISVYIGYSNCQIAFGTSTKIDGAFELDLGAGTLNRKFDLGLYPQSFFKQISLRNYIHKKICDLAPQYNKWIGSLKVDPELMAVGQLPYSCLKLIDQKRSMTSMASISAIPPTTASVVELSKTLLSLTPAGLEKLPGLEPDMRDSITSGVMILRGILEFCNVYDFRVTPYGLCAGMLKSPACVFSAVKVNS